MSKKPRVPWAVMAPAEEAYVLDRVRQAAESGDFTMPRGDAREIACLREICRQQADRITELEAQLRALGKTES